MEVNLQKMMRDPNTASSRIYIGNIPDGVSQQDIQNKFSKYGPIRGVLLNRGFGFVQFDGDNCANQAIQHENGCQLNGRKLNVRNAMKNKVNPQGDGQIPTGPIVGQDLNRQARPVMTQNWNNRSILQSTRDMGRDRSPLTDKVRDDDRWGSVNNMANNGNNFQAPPQKFNNDRNDCEIIVVNKAITQYAEVVEARLKRLGMLVDLLFPNPDVPMGKVLANISSRGCLFAIVVTPQNQEHRSITVNILFGEPAEHRNMPVDDAIEFIFRTFEDQMRVARPAMPTNSSAPVLPTAVQITPTAIYAAPPLNAVHPEAIQLLINLLAENRPITVLQYDRVIKYLQERRELQLKAEVGDAPPDIPIPPPVDTESELQKKILDILNKPSITNTPKVEVPKPQPKPVVVPAKVSPPTTSNSKPQLLNDPQVQKALDSLLSGSMFKF
ncbi:Nuclear receptor coactivator 5 [Pseudolycoriella hygida]|uniref:Nuclear receptor coactivator 5 n=1 Tax=Pseudolycoriella hygida TaxID=35572 RepID=A0A9Q0S4U8_9DIPT|nr:Nuclear receptor coactivator 5 [Pseudolycoriella hygida]